MSFFKKSSSSAEEVLSPKQLLAKANMELEVRKSEIVRVEPTAKNSKELKDDVHNQTSEINQPPSSGRQKLSSILHPKNTLEGTTGNVSYINILVNLT